MLTVGGLIALTGLAAGLQIFTFPYSPRPVATVLADTWLPPLISTVVGVTLAALAGVGIGGLRPLGRSPFWC